MTSTEIDDEFEFDDRFRMFVDAVNRAFEDEPDVKRQWRVVLKGILEDEIGKVEKII